jgi:hypothetical protein
MSYRILNLNLPEYTAGLPVMVKFRSQVRQQAPSTGLPDVGNRTFDLCDLMIGFC